MRKKILLILKGGHCLPFYLIVRLLRYDNPKLKQSRVSDEIDWMQEDELLVFRKPGFRLTHQGEVEAARLFNSSE